MNVKIDKRIGLAKVKKKKRMKKININYNHIMLLNTIDLIMLLYLTKTNLYQ